MLGRLFSRLGRNRSKVRTCYIELPSTPNKNVAQELKTLNSQFGHVVDLSGIRDRDCRKNWFTGKNMMSFSLEHVIDEIHFLGSYEYLLALKVTGGGGSGAVDCFLYELKKTYKDSPVPILIHIATESEDIRCQINSAISLLVNLKLRRKGTIWLFSNSELIKDSGGSFSSANKNIANLIWCLAYADNSNSDSGSFDISLVSKAVFTGKFAEIPLQPTTVDVIRNIVEKAREMLSSPWINGEDLLWDNSRVELIIPGSVVVCLIPRNVYEKIKMKHLNIKEIAGTNDNINVEIIVEENIKIDYPSPIKLRKSRRELQIHTSPYSGSTIKMTTLTKISEECIKRCEKQCEEFLRRIHNAVASGDVKDPIKSTYLEMFVEEYGMKPDAGEYPWDEICRL